MKYLPLLTTLALWKQIVKKVESMVEAMQWYVEGHINEFVECSNFQQRVQQPSEMFNNFLVSLRELAKMCNFWSDKCAQKNIHDQIIEGLIDGITIEDLLQQKDLTLKAAINKCQVQEAGKRQYAEMARNASESISAIRNMPPQKSPNVPRLQS